MLMNEENSECHGQRLDSIHIHQANEWKPIWEPGMITSKTTFLNLNRKIKMKTFIGNTYIEVKESFIQIVYNILFDYL